MVATVAECRNLVHDGAVPKADADISGIGVIVAFLLSAYITFTATLVGYGFGMIDDSLLGSVDRRVFRVRSRAASHPRVFKAVRKTILSLSDQQIITGIAIMGAGFQGLRAGISVYHYQIVIYLAWLSSSVHLSALAFLGPFFQERKALLYWRLSGMLVLLVMLLVGLVPTISNLWGIISWPGMASINTGWGIPAICFWRNYWGAGVSPDAVLGYAILTVSYIWRIGALFDPVHHIYNNSYRYPMIDSCIKLLQKAAIKYMASPRLTWLWTYRVLLCLILPCLVMTEVAASFAASIWLSALGVVFGTMQVQVPRNQVIPYYTADQEDTWAFGQLVPLILLIQPLGAVCEHIGKTPDEDGDSEASGDRAGLTSETTRSVQHSRSLLVFLTQQNSAAADDLRRRRFMDIVYECWSFEALVWFANCAIAAIAALVFWFDGESIGYYKIQHWQWSLTACGGCVLVAMLFTLSSSPFTHLGGVPSPSDEVTMGATTSVNLESGKRAKNA